MLETRHVLPDQITQVGRVLALAFAEDPVMHWLFPASQTRADAITSFMTMACRRSMAIGHAYSLPDFQGAALWAPPGVDFYDEAVGAEFYGIAVAVNGDRMDMVMDGLSGLAAHHPDEPHFYLSNIGVDPAERGNGLGAVLLNRVLATCDAEGIVAYLESSNPRNISLYERAGFEASGELRLPDGPVMTPMVRQPKEIQGL